MNKVNAVADPSGRTEYLEATLGLVKRLEISKELIRECVTVPGCCCCMPLLHNHLMDSCSYVRKIHYYSRQRGGSIVLDGPSALRSPEAILMLAATRTCKVNTHACAMPDIIYNMHVIN